MNRKKHLTTKELPESERPYEKCLKKGAEYLSDAELLAVIIRTGSRQKRSIDLARDILSSSKLYAGLIGINFLTLKDLMSMEGVGKVKAVQILCIAELTKRMAQATRKEGLKFVTPRSVADYYMEQVRHLQIEQIVLVMMDSKSRLIKDLVISTGTVNASLMAPREIFLNALKHNAVNIILIHNHPSGDPTPSKEDIYSTRRVKEAGILIGIQLMDHIIIGDNKYISLNEKGFFNT